MYENKHGYIRFLYKKFISNHDDKILKAVIKKHFYDFNFIIFIFVCIFLYYTK